MSRLRSLLVAAGVTLSVFTYFSLPILRKWYGPAVDLVVYAGIALVAGLLTYFLVNGVTDPPEESKPAGQKAFEEEMEAVESEGEDEEVEEMLEEL